MTYEQNRPTAPGHLPHFPHAFLLELRIPHRQDLINDEDLGLEVCCHGEGEADVHAGGIALDGGVKELLDVSECNDFVELPANLGPSHAEDGAVEVDVLAASELGVETRADLQEARHPAL